MTPAWYFWLFIAWNLLAIPIIISHVGKKQTPITSGMAAYLVVVQLFWAISFYFLVAI